MSGSAASLKSVPTDAGDMAWGVACIVKESNTMGCENDTFYEWASQDG